MARKGYYAKLADANDHDPLSVPLTPSELRKIHPQDIITAGYRLSPGDAVYIPRKEYRETYMRSIRKGFQPNVPVVVAIRLYKYGDKYKLGATKVEIGLGSLFSLDLEGKPHEDDQTSASVAHLPNLCEKLDALGGKAILAGDEVTISVPRREVVSIGNSRISTSDSMYSNDGKQMIRQARIIPSRILNDDEWE